MTEQEFFDAVKANVVQSPITKEASVAFALFLDDLCEKDGIPRIKWLSDLPARHYNTYLAMHKLIFTPGGNP